MSCERDELNEEGVVGLLSIASGAGPGASAAALNVRLMYERDEPIVPWRTNGAGRTAPDAAPCGIEAAGGADAACAAVDADAAEGASAHGADGTDEATGARAVAVESDRSGGGVPTGAYSLSKPSTISLTERRLASPPQLSTFRA